MTRKLNPIPPCGLWPVACGLLLLPILLGLTQQPEPAPVFKAIHIYLDPQAQPLAAYQFEFNAAFPEGTNGSVKLVGIEGGEHAAFAEPPHYDPQALHADVPRIIIAAFNTGDALPTGKTRIATLHVQVIGEPDYTLGLKLAASADAKTIPASISIGEE